MVKTFNVSIPGFEMGSTGSADESEGDVDKLCEDTESSGAYCLDHFETLPKQTGCFAHTLQLVVWEELMMNVEITCGKSYQKHLAM